MLSFEHDQTILSHSLSIFSSIGATSIFKLIFSFQVLFFHIFPLIHLQGRRHVMRPPKFFKTSIIVGRNRSHTFSFKSWPPHEKNLAPPPIRSHKNAPPQIPTFHLFDFSFHSLRHVSHIPHLFSWVRLCPIAIQSPMLYWCGNYH